MRLYFAVPWNFTAASKFGCTGENEDKKIIELRINSYGTETDHLFL